MLSGPKDMSGGASKGWWSGGVFLHDCFLLLRC